MTWLDVLVGVYFLFLALVLPLISIVYFGQESEHVDQMLKKIEEEKAAKAAANQNPAWVTYIIIKVYSLSHWIKRGTG